MMMMTMMKPPSKTNTQQRGGKGRTKRDDPSARLKLNPKNSKCVTKVQIGLRISTKEVGR
jgi:hypothetical protein